MQKNAIFSSPNLTFRLTVPQSESTEAPSLLFDFASQLSHESTFLSISNSLAVCRLVCFLASRPVVIEASCIIEETIHAESIQSK